MKRTLHTRTAPTPNYLRPAEAVRLVVAIKNFWANRGYPHVHAWIEQLDAPDLDGVDCDGQPLAKNSEAVIVKSNLVRGRPPPKE
jgi:hypothetical protein